MPQLTDLFIRKLPLLEHGRKKFTDAGNGLYLVVSVQDKTWYVRSRIHKKEQNIKLGKYPALSLAAAREQAAEIRSRLYEGLTPIPEKHTFSEMMSTWLDIHKLKVTPAHYTDIQQRLNKHILPHLGEYDIEQITPHQILSVLQKIASTGHVETARRLRQYVSRIFSTAVKLGYVKTNPAAELQEFLPKPKVQHVAAITKPDDVRALFNACVNYYGSPTVRNAMVLCALTAARPGMILHMEWSEIDMQNHVWTIPAHKMKMKKGFRTPLSDSAMTVIHAQRQISTGVYVFPGRQPGRSLSENTMRMALKTMGYEHLPHGWRSSFSTNAYESGLWRTEVIEAALAHENRSKVAAAYARTDFFDERKSLMKWWSQFLLDEKD